MPVKPRNTSTIYDSNGYEILHNSAMRLTVDSVDNSIYYVGEAQTGTLDTDAKWKIYKLDSTVLSIKYADGNPLYDNIWSDREGLTYV